MSKKTVHQIIGKAVLDKEYLQKLVTKPQAILSRYKDLTKKEIAMLSTLSIAQTSKMQGTLSKRVSKGHCGEGF